MVHYGNKKKAVVQSFENNWCRKGRAKNKQLVSHSWANDHEQTILRVCGGTEPIENVLDKSYTYVKGNVSSLQK